MAPPKLSFTLCVLFMVFFLGSILPNVLVLADAVVPTPVPAPYADSDAYPPAYFANMNYSAARKQFLMDQVGFLAEIQCRAYCENSLYAAGCKP